MGRQRLIAIWMVANKRNVFQGLRQLDQFIYKIVSGKAWQTAEREGVFPGAEIDLRDGYMHFSAAHQVRETLEKHFPGQANLLLVAVDVSAIEDGLRWEPSRGGALFPHLYRELKLSEVYSVEPINENRDPVPCPKTQRKNST